MKFTLIFALVTVVSAFGNEPTISPTPATGTPTPGYSIANCVRPFDAAAVDKTAVGYQFWFADGAFANGNTVKMSVVGPHLATHPPHRHLEDEYFFVVEGTAEFYLDGERRVVGPMTLLYCPSWHEHGIRNIGETDMKYLVLKKYLHPVPHDVDVQQVPGAAQPPLHVDDPARLLSSETKWLKEREVKLAQFERTTGLKILLQFHPKSPSAEEDKKPGAYMHALAKKLGVDRRGVLVVYFHDDPDWRVWIGDELTNAFTGKSGTVEELTASEAIHETKEAMLTAARAEADAAIEKVQKNLPEGQSLPVAQKLIYQTEALLDSLQKKITAN